MSMSLNMNFLSCIFLECLGSIVIIVLVSHFAYSQDKPLGSPNLGTVPVADAGQTPNEIATASLSAHGGDKLKKMRSFLAKGPADLNFMGQAISGFFSIAMDGDKYHFELITPFQSMKQVYDGHRTVSSFPGVLMPPIGEMGFFVLQRVGDSGYLISALVESKKKRRGFRITTPDGIVTDFFVNEKTGLIKGYESSYDDSVRKFTTAGEIDEYQAVDGLMIPKKYSQRFDLGQMTGYASYNAKNILVNPQMAGDAFAIPK